ncbi:hypothetical protein VCHA50O413_20092 [Vibrio chagasii]|nr:hypothetical protein VCHA35O142_10175 [Vibrio chagasii]CAH6915018.1 hypothetical protein VCHA53O468_100171 [Vibrio chagasii]CAH6956615.1 hypothetical protein VCHA43P273_130139 [Vibrio chagasii]CAH6957394.1 hypothetical protein VCHA35O143_30200 [Vibrio chagasii]CAH6975658.1 hypothetical protein VCHA50O405_10092 [Vibrio chagasii]
MKFMQKVDIYKTSGQKSLKRMIVQICDLDCHQMKLNTY